MIKVESLSWEIRINGNLYGATLKPFKVPVKDLKEVGKIIGIQINKTLESLTKK